MTPQDESDALNDLVTRKNPNRAQRRRKPTDDPWATKTTHRIKKIRKKNAPTKQQRKRAIATARKANKESHSQVS